MALKYGNNNITSVIFNDGSNKTVNTVVFNGTIAWERPYTLTISTVNPSYIKSYSVTRSATKEPTASTGALSTGATIYHEDTLATSATAADTVHPSISAPTFGTTTSTSIVVNNQNAFACTLTYGTATNPTGGSQSIPANSSKTITGLSVNTKYYFKLAATKTTYSVSTNPVSVNSVTGNVTITFTGSASDTTISAESNKTTLQTYTVTFASAKSGAGTSTGSWTSSSLTVDYGTTWTTSNNVVTIGGTTNTYTKGTATGYSSTYSISATSGTVTSATTITGTTTYTPNTYNISVTKNTGISKIYYKINGATSFTEWTSGTITGATYATTCYWYATAATGYSSTGLGTSSSPNSFTVSTSNSIAPTTSRLTYIITFTNGTYGTWNTSSITAQYGDTISRNSNVITVYKWDASSTARGSSTYSLPENTDQYTYSTSYPSLVSPITAAASYKPTDSRTTNKYAVNIGATTYCKSAYLSTSSTATSGSASGTAFDYGATVYLFVTLNDDTTQYTYTAPSGWTNISGRIYRVTSLTVGTSNTFADVSATRTTNKYTVTFSASNGSWSTSSIANVPYGTSITRSGATVTVTGYGSSTYTKASTTVSQTAGDASYTVPASVAGATTVSASTAMSTRTYTIKWIGADGSTALETDTSVAYNAVLTYNSATPTKAQTDQYTYSFSAWKLGSTSGSTVVSGTTKNPGSTSSTTINIYSTFSPTERSYTVSFTAGTYGSWSTASITALYSAAISRSGDVVTVGTQSSTYSGYTATGYTTTVSYTNASGTVGTGKTITATTTRTANPYDITVTKNTGIANIYYKVNGASSFSTWTSGTISANYNTTVYWYATAETGYSSEGLGTSSNPNSFVMGTSGTIAPTTSKLTYTVTLSSTYGSWKNSGGTVVTQITGVVHGTAASKSGTTLTVGTSTYTFNKNTDGTQYYYTNATIGTVPSTITGATTISGSATRNTRIYTVSGTSSNGTVYWSTSDISSSGGSTSLSNVSYGTTVYYRIDANTGYSRPSTYYGSYVVNDTNFTLNTSSLTATKTLSACTINSYAVTISATYCKATYLSTNSSATSGSPSGTSFNYNSTVYGFATLNDDTTEYTYTAPSGWTQISGRTYRVGSTTVTTSGGSISVSANRTANNYTVTINRATGVATYSYKIDSGSWVNSQTAASVTVSAGSTLTVRPYTANSGYTVNTSATQTASSATTLTLTPATCTLTLTKNTGVYYIGYKVNGASSWSYAYSSKSVSFNYGTTIYWFAPAESAQYSRDDSYISSSSYATKSNQTTSTTVSPTATKLYDKLYVDVNTGVSYVYVSYRNTNNQQTSTYCYSSDTLHIYPGSSWSWSAEPESGYSIDYPSSGSGYGQGTISPTATSTCSCDCDYSCYGCSCNCNYSTPSIYPPSVICPDTGQAEIVNGNSFTVELYVDGMHYSDMSAYQTYTFNVGSGWHTFSFYGNGEWSEAVEYEID